MEPATLPWITPLVLKSADERALGIAETWVHSERYEMNHVRSDPVMPAGLSIGKRFSCGSLLKTLLIPS